MLDSYRRVLAFPGAIRFTTAGLLARLPIAMVSLGLLLLVEETTGSYGVAGTVSATFVVSQALFAVLQGRLVDRLGQGRVLRVTGLGFGVALLLVTAAAALEWPRATVYAAAALAGALLPAVGASVRARWAGLLAGRPADVSTAYAFESVADEAVFILGPIAVTTLATAWHPVAGMVVAITAGLVGTLWFASQRATEPPVHARHHATGAKVPMPWLLVIPMAVGGLALGAVFGSAEVTTVAFSEELGIKQYSGVLLAIWAFGSLLAGVLTGAMTWQGSPARRVRIGAIGMAAAMAPLPFITNAWVMGAWLFVAGFAVSPTLIATMALLEQSVPAARLTESMTVVHTGLLAGVAPGAAFSGMLVDSHGASAAFWVPVGAGLLAAVAAQTLRGRILAAGRREDEGRTGEQVSDHPAPSDVSARARHQNDTPPNEEFSSVDG